MCKKAIGFKIFWTATTDLTKVFYGFLLPSWYAESKWTECLGLIFITFECMNVCKQILQLLCRITTHFNATSLIKLYYRHGFFADAESICSRYTWRKQHFALTNLNPLNNDTFSLPWFKKLLLHDFCGNVRITTLCPEQFAHTPTQI